MSRTEDTGMYVPSHVTAATPPSASQQHSDSSSHLLTAQQPASLFLTAEF